MMNQFFLPVQARQCNKEYHALRKLTFSSKAKMNVKAH